MCDALSVKVQNAWCTLSKGIGCTAFPRLGGMAAVVDPGSPSGSGPVIRK